MLELTQQPVRRLAFQPLHQTAHRHLRRHRHKQVHVVLRNMPLDDLYLLLTAYLPDQIPDPVGHILPQDRFPILGDPHQMQVDHEYRMRAVPTFRHNGRCTKSVLKLPPKGGGFNPPKVRTISCYQCDVERETIPLKEDSATVILALHLIEHLDHPRHFLGEVYRLLRPGAHVYLVTPDWRKQMKTFWRDPTQRHPYDRISIARLLRIHGYNDVWTSPWNSRYGFGRFRAYRFFPRLGMIGTDIVAHGRKPL